MLIDTPIRIGAKTAQNRLVMPPMRTNKARDGCVTEELLDYYRERAHCSHPGIVIIEHSFICEEGRASVAQLSLARDENISEQSRIADAIHEEGCLAFLQINHAGSRGIGECVSASAVSNPSRKNAPVPRELAASEIRVIEEQFAEAATRAVKAGYDGVEIHSAHGYLLNQFYSPLSNIRTDNYGGSLKNRLRFLLETVALVREVIGMNTALAVRLGGADYMPFGATEEDATEAAVLLDASGIDLLDISGGMCSYIRPGHSEPGYFSSMTEKIKKQVDVPVMLTGGVTHLSEAEIMLKDLKADLIGVGRALLADPNWRKKAE